MKYFIIEQGKQQGPFTIYELKDKGINSDTPVWSEGMDDWMPAGKVEELRGFLFNTNDKSTPPPYIPPRTSMPDVSHDDGKKGKRSGCWVVMVLLLLGLAIFLFATNPDKQQHANAIKGKIVLALDQQASNSNNIVGLGVHVLGKFFVNQLSDKILNEMLEYHNYGLFSKCSVSMKGKTHTVSYGLVSHVFTANEDDIANYLKENIPPMEDILPIPNINFDTPAPHEEEEAIANDTTNVVREDNLGRDLQEELVNSMGRIIKKQVGKNADSATTESVGKLIDDIIDLMM